MTGESNEDRRVQPDRRRIDEITEEFRTSVIDQLTHGEERMAGMASAIQQNTDIMTSMQVELKKLQERQGETTELLEFFKDVKGAFKVFDAIGKLAKPMGAIIALGVAMAGAWKAWLGR